MFKRWIAMLTVLTLAIGFVPGLAGAASLTSWTLASPKVTGESMNAVVYANGNYVMVGGNVGQYGTIMTSSDGVDWTRRVSNTSQRLDDITYGGGKYIAVGTNGAIVSSTDTETWTSRASGTTSKPIFGVTYGNGIFVAVGHSDYQDAYIGTSTDGENWTVRHSGTKAFLFDVVFGNGMFVATGSSGAILTSTDGTTWTPATTNTTVYLQSVLYDGSKFVAVGENGTILTSTNGTTWTPRTSNTTKKLEGIELGNNLLVATGQYGAIVTSPDGVTWTSRPSITSQTLMGISYDGHQFLAVGSGGVILSSADGIGWSSLSITNDFLQGVSYGNGTFVTTGYNGVLLTSSNGADWTKQPTNSDKLLKRAAFGDGKFVVVGEGGTILTSSDGLSWSSAVSNTTKMLNNIVYAAGQFVAIGDSTILTSANGTDWTLRSNAEYRNMTGVAYGNGKFVVVGYNYIITSVNGTDWTTATSGNTNYQDVAFGGDKFVIVGKNYGTNSNTAILGSSDGTAWTTTTLNLNVYIYQVTYGEGIFVAAIGDNAQPLLVSNDGTAWTSPQIATPYGFYSAAFGNGRFVAIGPSGTIAYADTFADASGNRIQASPARVPEGGSVTLTATGDMQSTASGAIGTARFVPVGWTSTENGKSGTFHLNNGVYVSDYEVSVSGNYAVTATFAKQTWDGSSWTDSGTSDTKTTSVTVIGQHAASPTITVQPGDRTATVGETSPMMSVTALSNDGGTLSYQWYANASNSLTGGTPIAGATSASYSAPTTSAGTIYYYVEVTNTNADATVTQTATISSDIARVTVISVPNAPTRVSAVAGDSQATVSFAAPADDGGDAVRSYEVTVSPGGAVIQATASPVTVTELTNGTSYTFTVTAVNTAGRSAASDPSNAVTPMAPSPGGSGGGGYTPVTEPSAKEVDVFVNGKAERAGTLTTGKQGDRTVTTVLLDPSKLDARLKAEGQHALITVPLLVDTDIAAGELNGQMVKNMEQKQAVLEIKTEKAAYKLPAQQINIDAIFEQLGKPASLANVIIRIEIAEPNANQSKAAQAAAANEAFTLVAPPVAFKVTASYGGRTIELDKFNAYVERTIALPAGLDPNRVTTGVVIEPDGTVRHVPTKVTVVDGSYYAVINSVTNSTYSIIWHPLAFSDVTQHWAEAAINEMGSRMIVNGTGEGLFNPNRDITRAEFATILVKGLGLKIEADQTAPFHDVKAADWFNGAVRTAYANGLIKGFEDGNFRPNDNVTREQAMVMIANAMAMTGLRDTLPAGSADTVLAPYQDAELVSEWARDALTDSIQAGLLSGRSADLLAPKAHITRAEVAIVVRRLLQQSDLI